MLHRFDPRDEFRRGLDRARARVAARGLIRFSRSLLSMRSLLRSTLLAAGALSLSFVLVGCDAGNTTTPAPTPPATPTPPAPGGPDAGKGAMEGPAAKPEGGDAAKPDASPAPAVEKPKEEAPK